MHIYYVYRMSIKKIKENISKIFKIKNKKCWLPLSIMVVSIILWIGLRYTVSLSILNLEWLVVASVGMASWCWYCRLRIIACIILAGGIILAYQLFISLPSLQQSLEKAKSGSPPVWVRGPIIKAIHQGKDVHLHLAPAELFFKGERQRFFEIIVQLLSKSHSFNSFYHRRPIQLSGILTGADLENQRLAISLKQVLYHTSYSPLNSWYYFGKIVHQHLRNRAAYYLPAEIFSLYSPLILARTVSRSESLQLFRATGLAHLLAISGLHIGLLYWLGLALFRLIGRCSQHILLWIHFSNFCQLLTLAGLWLYVALIAFPVPALRAVVMLTILVVIRWLGQSQAPLYALLSTAFLFLCFRSAVIYDLSFQLSFVAVLYIILILPVLKNISRDVSYWRLVIIYIWNSIGVTGSVLVGIWPILLTHFHQLSLEVFWLNIIMLPMLAFLILPVCFTALFISLFNWQALPFGIWEKTAFQVVECVLRIWLDTLSEVHSWGGWATIQMELHWSGWQYGLYYLTTILLFRNLVLRILAQKKRRDSRKF